MMELCKPLIEYCGARNNLNPLLTTINTVWPKPSAPSLRRNIERLPVKTRKERPQCKIYCNYSLSKQQKITNPLLERNVPL